MIIFSSAVGPGNIGLRRDPLVPFRVRAGSLLLALTKNRMVASASWCLVVALALIVSGDLCPAQSPSAARDLSVMTWNVEWFFDESSDDNYSDLAIEKTAASRQQWEWKRDVVAAGIAAAKPTIVALQEVENRRVLWYLSRALNRNHKLSYQEVGIEGRDFFTEQDVGMMIGLPAEVVQMSRMEQTRAMKATERYFSLSKHLMTVVEFPVDKRTEQVYLLNLHLRAKPETAALRVRQARLAHLWVADLVKAGKHVIVLGDMNTEIKATEITDDSDMGVLCGMETKSTADDLVDLNQYLPADMRGTHLLPGREFDRICVSKSLVADDPNRSDLVFSGIRVMKELNIRKGLDSREDHWDGYWEMPDDARDVSDHLPVMATFQVR